MNRTEILKKANECVMGDREQDYGSPEDNFDIIAKLWSTYLDFDITAVDVAMMMSLLKVARVKSGRTHEDNFIDLAGYAACAGEIASNGADEKACIPKGNGKKVEFHRYGPAMKDYFERKLSEYAKVPKEWEKVYFGEELTNDEP